MTVPLTVRQGPSNSEAFSQRVELAIGGALKAISIRTVQLNIGLRCNLSCGHCHVESSPRRREQMSWEIMALAIETAKKVRAATVDITGGEPILHPQLPRLIKAARKAELQVMLRTNLTALLKKQCADLPAFFKANRVRIVGSLPSCEEMIVDAQRGPGVYRDSIEAIRRLNAIGYGIEPTLPLDLVHNPHGPLIPPPQLMLERDYKRTLDERFGLRFTQLFTVVNMPIGRFQRELDREGKMAGYLQKLQSGFNADTLDGLMCRHQLHVAYDGSLHDCDFNYAAGLPVRPGTPNHISDFDATTYLQRQIATASHCFGCTACRGSSFGGAIV